MRMGLEISEIYDRVMTDKAQFLAAATECEAAQRPVTSTASGDLLRHSGDARIQMCRYVVWSITVPLLIIEFNLILEAAQRPVTSIASGDSSPAPRRCSHPAAQMAVHYMYTREY